MLVQLLRSYRARGRRGQFAAVNALDDRENGVRLVRDAGNAQWITPAVGARLDALADSIVSGAIQVPQK